MTATKTALRNTGGNMYRAQPIDKKTNHPSQLPAKTKKEKRARSKWLCSLLPLLRKLLKPQQSPSNVGVPNWNASMRVVTRVSLISTRATVSADPGNGGGGAKSANRYCKHWPSTSVPTKAAPNNRALRHCRRTNVHSSGNAKADTQNGRT